MKTTEHLLHSRAKNRSGRTPLVILFLLAGVCLLPNPAAAQSSQTRRTRNPHGALNIACENCHSSTSWKPIRPSPDFSHKETRFPLRGNHEGVDCRRCHVKLVFSDVGTQCADCHADIHRRQFGGKCEECHTVRGWRVSVQAVKSHQNRFPLLGAHAAVDCNSCHKGAAAGQFLGLSTECVSCHLKNYQSTTLPDHRTANLSTRCDTCHRMDGWRGASFDHAQATGFSLAGAHTRLDCMSCHVGNRFSGVSPDCFSCHAKDYNRARNPDHTNLGFPKDCSVCHSSSTWIGAKFDHNARSSFALTGAHQRAICTSCHVSGRYSGTPRDCYSCHLNNYESSKNPDHKRGGYSSACATCHETDRWQGARFDHGATHFPLLGAHASVGCQSCHINNKYNNLSVACLSCHQGDYDRSARPNHRTAGFPTDCVLCHDSTKWQGAKFDHDAATKFPLTGAHVSANCASCHKNEVYKGTSNTCVSCHLTNLNNTKNPNHSSAGFPQDCAVCHNTTQWLGAKFDHNTATKFALTGAHIAANCASCHKNEVYKGTSGTCVSCHLTNLNNTKNPNHSSAGFPQDCAVCHNTTQWLGAKFDHNSATKFALTGAHVSANCASCHKNEVYKGTSSTCVSCHLTNFNNTKSPNHVSAGFPQDCSICHTTTQWQGAKFDHNTATKFALTGAHISASCSSCHKNDVYKGTSSTCVSCHLTNLNNTKSPNHVSAGFPQDCSVCHNTTQWLGAKFDHNSATKFVLTGAHVSANCASCHKNNVYKGTSSTCVSCHLTNFNNTKNPNHVTAGFSQECAVCHTTNSWLGAKFDHAKTKFPLTGAHVTVDCTRCHIDNKYAGTASDCISCHLNAYNNTKSPSHLSAGFPRDCTVCHNTTQWLGAKFDHNTATKFALTGAHISASCSSCHKNEVYKGTSSTCASCHLTNFNNTKSPNHVSAGFPQDCSVCHTTTQWLGAKFDHNTATKFALTGAHISASCSSCHKNEVYKGTSSTCVSCHLTNFNKTKSPNHISAGFSQDCSFCHTTAQWLGAKYDHNTATKFALTGAHISTGCAACHKNEVYKGTSGTCVSCHLTNLNNAKSPNHVSAGFPQDCSVCHNTTQWLGAKFDHNTATKFALSGAHISASCSSCHKNEVYKGTSSTCVSCHLTNFNNTKSPNHVAAGFSQDCSICHTTAQWLGAKFDHNTATKFALTGAHISASCLSCHKNNVYKGTSSTCVSCHLTNFNNTKSPNHVATGFSQDCSICHTTTQWLGAKFNHNTATKFALTGAHISASCSSCHKNEVYKGTPSTCVSCHLTNFNNTKNPNHISAGFPQDCSICHNTTQWLGATFDHSKTRFILTGTHKTATCTSCHINNQYVGTPTQCDACHITDYNKTTNPNHSAAAFPKDCSLCHSTTNWQGAAYDHSKTKFPLTGAHASAKCMDCHSNGKYAGLDRACVSCHLTRFNNTKNPNHISAGFPQDCAICHSTTAWIPSSFNHATTKFPLTGAHKTVLCVNCHIGGKYAGTPTDCYSCHQKVYTSTTDPNHTAAGFPKDCTVCHTTTTWKGATFAHKFPIYSGSHNKKWTTCSDCHTNSNNYTVFSCLNCHAHEKIQMDNKHKSVKNYVYNSANCYACHPQGKN